MQDASLNEQSLQTDSLPYSPVQEHHIDFLLEEEFACNPDFLNFFINAATEKFQPSKEIASIDFIQPASQWDCKAIRSVTTGKGETDVLAIYRSKDKSKRIAILIEDKIRANFQPDQAQRYRDRGEAGKELRHRGETGKELRQWDYYWTCLIAPAKYAKDNDNMGFDTRISLEKLTTFFSGTDLRTRFKWGVIQAALTHFSETGVRLVDQTMTDFRAFYANEASCFFNKTGINWQPPRNAWWGDTWFRFKGTDVATSATTIYKAEAGYVDFSFPNCDVSLLQKILDNCEHPSEIVAWQTGKSASFRVAVKPISDFGNHAAAKPAVVESFQKVRELIAFYKANEALINSELQIQRNR